MKDKPLSVRASTLIAAPPAQIYPLLADASQRPGWMTELVEVEAASGPVVAGDRFSGRSAILFHEFLGVSEVQLAEPDRAIVEQVVIGARFVSRWEIEPQDNGAAARILHAIDVEFPAGPFSRIERWVLRRRLLRMQRESLRNLSRRLAGGDSQVS